MERSHNSQGKRIHIRWRRLVAEAERAGLDVRQYASRVEIGRVGLGGSWLIGVAIHHDGKRFLAAHRIDVPLELSENLRSARACYAVLADYLPPLEKLYV